MKKVQLLSKSTLQNNRLSSVRLSNPLNYVLILLSSLLLSTNSIAQSYSLSTTGAVPDSSAMLDIISSNKGLLIPRVYLSSVTDSTTIAHPAISLQVYNTNPTLGNGFWYWDGTKWIRNIGGLGVDSLVIGSGTSSHLYNIQVTGTAGVSTSLTTPLLVGGKNNTDSITYKTTTANGTTGADHVFRVGDNGNRVAMRILNSGKLGIGMIPTNLIDVTNTTNGINGLTVRNTQTNLSTSHVSGISTITAYTPTDDLEAMFAGNFGLSINGAQTITDAFQGPTTIRATTTNLSTAGTITNLSSMNLSTNNGGNGNVSNMNGIHIRNSWNTGGGTVTNV